MIKYVYTSVAEIKYILLCVGFLPVYALHWRHNDHGDVSNHQPRGCVLNRLFRRRWKKTSKLRVTGLCAGNSPGPVNSPHKGPVTRKMFPFDDVIMERSPDSLITCNVSGKNCLSPTSCSRSEWKDRIKVTETGKCSLAFTSVAQMRYFMR